MIIYCALLSFIVGIVRFDLLHAVGSSQLCSMDCPSTYLTNLSIVKSYSKVFVICHIVHPLSYNVS